MLDFNKTTLLYGLFNEYVFPEAKMNIDYLEDYYRNDAFTSNNTLIGKLIWLIKSYKFKDITEATFISALQEDGKSEAETKEIITKIREYKNYTREQSVVFRDNLKRLCYKAFADKVKRQKGEDIVDYVEDFKKFQYKSNYSDTLTVKNFSELEINDLIDYYSADGYKSRYDFINNSFTCGGYVPGQIVQVVAAPSVGKSLFLQGEAVNFIEQGKRVHYLTLGDLNELDMAIRMTCMMARQPKRVIESDILGFYDLYRNKFSNYLGLTVVPSGYVKVSEYVEWMIQMADSYDILMIDYDSNFARDPNLSMYDAGGDTYDMLTRLTRLGKLVFVASQPKISYFGEEKLPLDAAGESSRKQHISDMIITIGRRWDAGMRMGYFNIAKSRRGDNAEQPWIGTSEGLFYPCSDILYAKYRNNKSQRRLFTYTELEGMDILDSVMAEGEGEKNVQSQG